MTPDLPEIVSQYRQGLETQVGLLQMLAGLATDQLDAATCEDFDAVATILADRDRVMASLLGLESTQEPLRQRLVEQLTDACTLEGFPLVKRLHRVAERCVADVLEIDRRTHQRLDQSEPTRRSAAHALDAGEATLAAYRKALSPAVSPSSIVDRRG